MVLRDLGRDLADRSKLWPEKPTLLIWGWQSPLFFYSGLDGVSRHFFVDNLLKAYANSSHPAHSTAHRTNHERPPCPSPGLIFVGYPPFPELQAFLRERYLPHTWWGVRPKGIP